MAPHPVPVNPIHCSRCEASSSRPGDNLHCVADGEPHAWHTCGDIKSEARGSDCPEVVR